MRSIHAYMKRILVATLITIIALTGCATENTKAPQNEIPEKVDHPIVQITMQDGSQMVFELYPEYAPQTVENFVNLSQTGFYNGLKFHRIMKGFMIQGGDPQGDGTGGANENIPGEFAENGFDQNTLKHTKGIISMARSGNPNSASSQFFIMHGENSYLDGKYAAFGKLIQGEAVLDQIAETPVAANPNSPQKEVSLPVQEVTMKEVVILQ